MSFPKLAILLTTSCLLLGCTFQPSQTKSPPNLNPSANIPNANISLKEAIKELYFLEDKIKGGIDAAGYAVIMTKTSPLVQNAFGDDQAVSALHSAFKGHQLALQFWKCDRVNGFDALHQCRGEALSQVFSKYPDIATQAKAVVNSNNLATISAGLNKEEVLQAIWRRTSADIKEARQAISIDMNQQES